MTIKKTGTAEMTLLSESSWRRKQSDAKVRGLRDLRSKGIHDGEFDVRVLAPFEMRGNGHESVPLAAAMIDHDWRHARRLQMVDWARKLISEAYFLGTLPDELPGLLADAIQGQLSSDQQNKISLAQKRAKADLETQSLLAELNEWYTQFEKMHGKKLFEAMKIAAGSNADAWMDGYIHRGKPQRVPLPYAIRNTVDHHNPDNHWGIDELRTAVELLQEWLTVP